MKYFLKHTFKILFFVALFSLLQGCGEVTQKITGNWSYTLTDSNGNTYDQGTITFAGDGIEGDFSQKDFYKYESSGTYHLSGNTGVHSLKMVTLQHRKHRISSGKEARYPVSILSVPCQL